MPTLPLGLPVVFSETRAPTATDDQATLGVQVNFWWLRTDTGQWWVCRSNAVGAAVWDEMQSATALATIYQPLDATLTGLAALDTSTGLVEQTGATAFAKRAIGVGATTSVPTRADGDGRWGQLAAGNAWAGLQTFNGNVLLNATGSNLIEFRATGLGAPTFTTRSLGAKVVLWPSIGAASADYALGIESGALWIGTPAAANPVRFYAGTTLTMSISGAGLLSGPSIVLGGTAGRTMFSTPVGVTQARVVHQLASFRDSGSAATGAIVFSAAVAGSVMTQLRVKGLLYSPAHAIDILVQGYRTTGAWSFTRKLNLGTIDVQARLGVNPAGTNCLILGDVDTVWSYPHLAIVEALLSHTGSSDLYAQGWTAALVTDLTGYTQITATLTDTLPVGLAAAAHAHPARDLTIFDTTNLFPDPNMVDGAAYTGTDFVLSSNTWGASTNFLQIGATGGTVDKTASGPAMYVEAGRTYQVLAKVGISGVGGYTNAASLLIEWYSDLAATAVISTVLVAGNGSTAGRTTQQGGLFTAPAGALRARLLFRRVGHPTNTPNAVFNEILVRRAISTDQVDDATLRALAGLDTVPGAVVQTATDTFVKRSLLAGTGIAITDGDGVAGNPTVALTGAALAVHNGAVGVGPDPFEVLRAFDVGSAAFADARALSGKRVRTVNSNYTVTPQDHGTIFRSTSGAPTFTLPLWATIHPWFQVGFKARGTTITIARAGSDTIDGTTSISVTTGNSVMVGRADTSNEMESY